MSHQERESQLDDIFRCDLCKDKLKDPKFLPCGQTVCLSDILNRLDDNNGFVCDLCFEYHQMPSTGFVDNVKLKKMLEHNSRKEFGQTILERNLRSYLRELRKETNKFIDSLKDPSYLIKDQCASVKNEVKIAKQDTFLALNNNYNEIINRIEKYETDCLSNLKTDCRISNKIAELENKVAEFHDTWESFIKHYTVDEAHLNKAQSEAKKLLDEIERNDLKELAFNGRVLSFAKNNDLNKTPLLGFLNIDNIMYENENTYEDDD